MILEGLTIAAIVVGVLAALGMIILWVFLRRDEERARRTQALLDPIGDFA
jgi:hypothetical protein